MSTEWVDVPLAECYLKAMRIEIRPPSVEFAPLLHQWRNEPSTLKYNPVEPRTLEELRDGLSHAPTTLQPLESAKGHRWFIGFENEIVGTVALSQINMRMSTAEIGYMIGEKYYGRGIATAAVRIWTSMIFEQTPLRRLTASVAEANLASLRVMEKSGFVREGILREHYLIQDQPTNEVVFGLLRRDWEMELMARQNSVRTELPTRPGPS